jgi:hypothetical protein
MYLLKKVNLYMETQTLKPEVSEIGMFDNTSYCLNYTNVMIDLKTVS